MTRLNEASRQATAELIARFANAGRDDPTIAARLTIPISQVRTLRKEFNIPAGETRWVNPVRPATPASDDPNPPECSAVSPHGDVCVRPKHDGMCRSVGRKRVSSPEKADKPWFWYRDAASAPASAPTSVPAPVGAPATPPVPR